MIRVHLDTDLGSDTDDLCALAMLLGWPDVELTGVTTVSDPGGIRAGFVGYALGMAGRHDVPVAAGAEGSIGGFFVPPEFPNYWPEPIPPRPGPPGAALDLIGASLDAGATIVAVGPYTNVALFETAHPGALASGGTVVMGGWVTAPRAGLPPWTWDQDFNVQQDAEAAKVVFERCDPVVTQLATTLEVWLRRRHVPALEAGGPLASLIAAQGLRRGSDHHMESLGRSHDALPDDLLNFQYDPLACAVACGWTGVTIEEIPVRTELVSDRLRLHVDPAGTAIRVVTGVDAERFERDWLDAVLRASRGPARA